MKPFPGVVPLSHTEAVVLDADNKEVTVQLKYTRFGNFNSSTKWRLKATGFLRNYWGQEKLPKSSEELTLRIVCALAKRALYRQNP